jgi:GTP-binding protein
MKKTPTVAIMGFPNVGKSTLFNRLLGEKKSLIHSLPGMTRDSISAACTLEGKTFTLVDTGGFFGVPEEPLSHKVRERAWRTATEADLILFLLDGRREISPGEEEFYVSLKKLNKPLLVLVNKIDSPSQAHFLSDFYRLGEENLIPFSAEHKFNLDAVIEAVSAALPVPSAETEGSRPLRIAIIGRINVGKSSLINRLCGEEKLLVSEIPGTTRDSTDTLILRDQKPYCLVDTAGIRKMAGAEDEREKAGIVRAKRNIGQADVLCFVLDVKEFPTRQDAHIAYLAHESGKPLMIVLNKWDLVEKSVVKTDVVRQKVFSKLAFIDYAPLLFVSARTGRRVAKILDLAAELHGIAQKKVATARLNQFLNAVQAQYPPRSKAKDKVKIKYMTQTGVLPPTFLLFTHSRTGLAPSYEKLFIGLLRAEFDYRGTPIRLRVKRD